MKPSHLIRSALLTAVALTFASTAQAGSWHNTGYWGAGGPYTYTPPAGVTSVNVLLVAGGGGGGCSDDFGGGGGGGGGCVYFPNLAVSGNLTITVGGGALGTNCGSNWGWGSTGGATTVTGGGVNLAANGGGGGGPGWVTGGLPGAGGGGCGLDGFPGGTTSGSNGQPGGIGGTSYGCAGYGWDSAAGHNAVCTNGGGGGGGGAYYAGTQNVGGNGADGQVIIWAFY